MQLLMEHLHLQENVAYLAVVAVLAGVCSSLVSSLRVFPGIAEQSFSFASEQLITERNLDILLALLRLSFLP